MTVVSWILGKVMGSKLVSGGLVVTIGLMLIYIIFCQIQILKLKSTNLTLEKNIVALEENIRKQDESIASLTNQLDTQNKGTEAIEALQDKLAEAEAKEKDLLKQISDIMVEATPVDIPEALPANKQLDKASILKTMKLVNELKYGK